MHTTSTPCHVCSDHDTDLCPGSVPECPAFLDSLDLDATLALFNFPVSARTPDTYPRYFHGLIDRTTALCDLQSAGITL